jgi:DNA polymerase I-like protein with 3'-5' exonuclease and polymerase domains
MGDRPPTQFAETPKQARRFMDELYREAYLNGKVTAVDTEFVPVTHEPVLMSYSWGRGVRRVVRAELVKEHFGDWLTDDQTKIAYQNYKEDAVTMEGLGLPKAELVRSFYIDVMVAGVLRDETLVKHGLKAQMHHFLKWFRREYGQLFCFVPAGKKKAITMDPRQVMDDLPEDALSGAVLSWGGAKGTHKTGERSRETWRQLMTDYAGDDAEGTQRLAVDHRRYLKSTDYWDKYVNVDRPFTITLMQCESSGAFLDQPILRKILRKQQIRIMRAERCFRSVAGNPKLNLRSGPQMKKLLFDEWGWPEHPSVETDSGGVSMDKEVLSWWVKEHKLPMAEVKLAYNNARTMEGTFLTGLLTGVDDDGRLRSDLNQIGAKTSGRISSRKFDVLIARSKTLKSGVVKEWVEKKKAGANLQNIPARKEKDPDGIRGAFRAPLVGEVTAWGDRASEPHKLLVADYSGFHLVLVIHFVSKLTDQSAMLDIMKKYKTPSAVHVYTTIQMFKHAKPHKCYPDTCKDKKTGQWKKHHGENKSFSLKEFTMDDWGLVKPLFPDQYTYAKNTNFALIFLGSPWTLAYNTGRDANDEAQLEECKRHYDDWYELYPEIKIYQDHFIDHGYEHGWVPTIGGRRGHVRKMLEGCDREGRYIQDEEKRKKMIKHGERVCTNTPAQGSEADIVKDALNRIRSSKKLIELRVAPLFPVHDEVVCEGPASTATPGLEEQIVLMKEPYKDEMGVELAVEGGIGDNWISAKP